MVADLMWGSAILHSNMPVYALAHIIRLTEVKSDGSSYLMPEAQEPTPDSDLRHHEWLACRGRSDEIHKTLVPLDEIPRNFYLAHIDTTDPPYIICSPFVSDALVHHLLRSKKNSALGVKFEINRTTPDNITNMEGALHTFISPVVYAALHGDYFYDRGHHVRSFDAQGTVTETQFARDVLISAAIHPDFENAEVMAVLCALEATAVLGKPLREAFDIASLQSKQDATLRASYDNSLRRHLIQHLTTAGALPALGDVRENIWSVTQTIEALNEAIAKDVASMNLENTYVRSRENTVLSCEMLYRTALEQVRNECRLLEAICPQGYVLTYDPPAIFARHLDTRIITRMHIAALASVCKNDSLANMRMYGFNDYADMDGLRLTKIALKDKTHVHVVAKQALFLGPSNTYAPGVHGHGAMLVLHNNSDAFGQNIETEDAFTSMDGAIGVHSSAAASLHRRRPDLLSRLRQRSSLHT